MLAGKSLRFADQFVVGLSGETLTSAATALDFAWATVTITDSYVDAGSGIVVFYGRLPAAISGSIKEIGLISQTEEFIQSGLPNSLVYTFEPNELWYSDGTIDFPEGGLVGTGNIRLTPAAPANYVAKATNKVDVSRYDVLKMRCTATNVTSIKISLMNDDANYISKTVTTVNGENKIVVDLSTATTTGVFKKTEVNTIKIEIVTTSGSGTIEFDAMTLASPLNGGLVAREVLTEAKIKRPGATMNIEYGVEFS